MKLSLGWKGFDNFSSSENVFNPYCLNSFEPQKIFHFPRISLFVCFMLSVFFDLNQHHLKDPWLEKTWMWKQTTLPTIPRSFWMTERGPSLATNATTQAIDLAIWRRKKHVLVHNGSCTRCDYSSSASSSLKSQTMIHSGEKPFSSKQCNYSFTRSSHFKTHMLIHSGEKLYSCSHCSLSCTTAGNLKDHVRTHSGEKPFHCDQCNYTSTLTHLKRHKLKHTGEKLFSCSQCSFSCSRDGNLKDHIRIHSGEKPFKCNLCNYSSTRASHVKEHKRTYTGEKPGKCNQCYYSCT